MESDNDLFEEDSGGSSDLENSSKDAVDEEEDKKECLTESLRVDHCLICGEPAVFYNAGGNEIKRESSRREFSYQHLFDCLCKCVELRKNCRVKKEWDFYKDPFPVCGSCEQCLVSLAELYSKVEGVEEEIKTLIRISEEKFVSWGLYGKHGQKYRAFRKQFLKKGISKHKRASEASQSVSPYADEKDTKDKPDVQPERSTGATPEATSAYDHLNASASDCSEIWSVKELQSRKTPSTGQRKSSLDANKRRSLRKGPKPAYFLKLATKDEYTHTGDASRISEEDIQCSSGSSDNTNSSVVDNSESHSESEKEYKIKSLRKAKKQPTSTTTKIKAVLDKAKPQDKAPPRAKRKYTVTKIQKKVPTIFSRCPVCDKPIRKNAVQEYREHYWSHLSEEEKRAIYKDQDQDIPDLSSLPPMKNLKIKKRKAAPLPQRVQSGDAIQCHTCGKFVGKNIIEQHMKTHMSLEIRQTYLCYLCGASFVFKPSLDNHLKKVHPDGNVAAAFKCQYPDCTSSHASEARLKNHVKDTHCSTSGEHPNKYLCDECGRLLSNPQLLKQHGLVHSKAREHVCHHCSMTFPLKTTLVTHLAVIHGEGRKTIVCEQTGCNKEFSHRVRYSAHLRNRHGIYVGKAAKGRKTPKKKKFLCGVCGVVFNYNISLKAHLSKVHPTGKEGSYVCRYPMCTSNFFTEPDLRSHVEQEHVANYEGGEHLCGLCGRVFGHAWSFKQHQLVHTKERNHACHLCSKTFPLKATLVSHLEGVHGEGKKEFKCEQEGCGGVFKARKYFMVHMRKAHGIYAKENRNSVR